MKVVFEGRDHPDSFGLSVGKVYNVISVSKSQTGDNGLIIIDSLTKIINDLGATWVYRSELFTTLEEIRNRKLADILGII